MSLLRGRGSSIGPMVPFRSLTEALMSLLRSGEPVDVRELGPYLPVLARLIPDLGPPSAGEDGGSLVVIAEAVLRLIGLVGRGRGCLLILDDLQDSDPETLAVVDYLVSNLDRQPAVLLGAVRADSSPALAVARSAAQRGCGALVELHRLGMAEVRTLVCSCLGDDDAEVPSEVVDHLWSASEGIPLLAEEVLNAMRTSGLLVRAGREWQVTGQLRTRPPATLTLTMAGNSSASACRPRADLAGRHPWPAFSHRRRSGGDRPGPAGAADRAARGYRRAVRGAGRADPGLVRLPAPPRQRVDPRPAGPRRASPAERPGGGGGGGHLSWSARGMVPDLGRAAPAGRRPRTGRAAFRDGLPRALAQGAANSAVALLDRALELLTDSGDAQERADVFASVLYALAEAGLVERAVTSVGELERLAGMVSRDARAQLHTRLAWAAAVAGRSADGLAQVAIARKLLGPAAAARDTAPVDVVAAHLALDVPGPGQLGAAEALARRAAEAAESAQLPVVACQAWQVLGALSRSRDPDEATACLERARRIAVTNDLPIEEIHTLIRLGNDDALRDGGLDRLRQAQREASRVGAVTSRYQAEASIALQLILQGKFAEAESIIGQVLTATTRLRLLETTQYTFLLRALLGAHQGIRADMEAALADLRRWEGDHPQHTPRVHGLARAWCALLEENRPLALRELGLALTAEEQNPTIFQLTGRYGLNLLLRVLDGTAGVPEYQAITEAPVSRLRWDRQFAVFAGAVLAGRAGREAEAAAAVAAAMDVGAPYRPAATWGCAW